MEKEYIRNLFMKQIKKKLTKIIIVIIKKNKKKNNFHIDIVKIIQKEEWTKKII